MLEIGKLYSCEEYFLLLCPDKTTVAVTEAAPAAARRSSACAVVAYWSKRFDKPVGYVERNIPLLVLNREGKYIEVLAGDQKGWIFYADWLGLRRLNNETIS